MAEENPLFRKVALERLSTPEQLDQLMEVTSPRTWLALSGLAVIVITALIWSVFGDIPRKVQGNGIFLTTGGTVLVVAPAGGQLVGFTLRPGDSVTAGALLARVAQPALAAEFAAAQAACDRARSDYERKATEGLGEDVRLKLLASRRRREAVNQTITDQREFLTQLQEKVRTQEELLAQGLITPQALLLTRREMANAQERIRQAEVELISISADEATLRASPEQPIEQREKELLQAEAALQQVMVRLEQSDRVESAFAGRVVEVFANDSDRIAPGAPVCTLELTDTAQQRLEAVLFVPAGDAGRIRPGHTAMLSPDNARKEEYGMIVGAVRSVAGYPASVQAVNRFLNNEALARTIAGDGTVIEVRADPLSDTTTASGYRWSSSGGYPLPPRGGTLCTTEIVVEHKRPIALVIPALKELLGIY